MYSPEIVDRRLWALSKKGLVYTIRPASDSVAIARALDKLVVPSDTPKSSLPSSNGFRAADGTLIPTTRDLLPDELAFIQSEILLCRSDFRYFAERYGYMERDAADGGGVGPAAFWPSQLRALDLIARREEDSEREFARYGFSEGIRGVWHKTRQQGATALVRLVNGQRMILYRNMRCIAASLDQDKVHEFYVRDKVFFDNLPAFLKPSFEFDVKDSHLGLESLKSRLVYQQANQRAGIGTSGQFDISHMTEVALWDLAERLQFDFIPTIPKARSTFVAWESTANGRGNFWHEFTESVRRREEGFGSWIYVFTPWYINERRNRMIPPPDWAPAPYTAEHAALVESTSQEFASRKVILTREQMYWWESEYKLNKKLGTLHLHLSNYPATPEQSFQTHRQPALPIETIEWMRTTASIPGMPYHAELGAVA